MFDAWKFSNIFSDNYDAHNDVQFTSTESYEVSIVFSHDSRDFKKSIFKKFFRLNVGWNMKTSIPMPLLSFQDL